MMTTTSSGYVPKDKKLPKGKMYITELFETIGKVRSKKDRAELLREYVAKGKDHEMLLKHIVEIAYHPAVRFALPPGVPPYEKNTAPDFPMAGNDLFKISKTLYRFLECKKKIESDIKREQIFIQTLEGLHAKEAELLVALKEKTFDGMYRGVKEGLFREAFPSWLPEEEMA